MRRMGMLGVVSVLLCTACGQSRPSVVRPQAAAALNAPGARAERAEAYPSAMRRYVDEDLGFEIIRPTAEWQLDETDERGSPGGMAIPVVLKHRTTGAQVVLQVAPAVATPTQFAERLSEGLKEHPGFVASEPEPLPLSDSAVGFNFTVEGGVRGRVAVTEGSRGRMLMMLATWPETAPEDVTRSVEALFGSVHPLPERG